MKSYTRRASAALLLGAALTLSSCGQKPAEPAKTAAAPAVLGLGPIAAKANGTAAGKSRGNAGPVVGFPPVKG
jgi:hypothetical protein